MQNFMFLRTVDPDVLRRAEIADFGVERSQFGDFDKGAESLLLDNLVGHRKFIVGAFPGKDGCPCVERSDSLLFERLRSQVFEQQIQLGQTVGNGRSRKEGRP